MTRYRRGHGGGNLGVFLLGDVAEAMRVKQRLARFVRDDRSRLAATIREDAAAAEARGEPPWPHPYPCVCGLRPCACSSCPCAECRPGGPRG